MSANVDKETVTKIVSNQMSNALKYAHRHISVELSRPGNRIVLKVHSDGEKIPHETTEQIFSPFFRMESNRNKAQGTGIGLALARSLAQLHQGELKLEEHGEPYNTFVLTLPVDTPEEAEHRTAPALYPVVKQEATAGNEDIIEENPSEEDSLPTHEYTILIVEDNEDMMRFLSGKIGELFDVRTAGNGREALEVLRNERIDLVVSDVMMPEMNGYEMCRILKSDMEICLMVGINAPSYFSRTFQKQSGMSPKGTCRITYP